MFNDPAKLLPLILTVGAIVLIALGRASVEQGMLMLGAAQGVHSLISAVNNPPK